MKHFSLKKCLKNAKWHDDKLQCSCGKELAIRYMLNEEVRVFVHGKFKKFKQEILARKDIQEIARKSELLGNLDYEEGI